MQITRLLLALSLGVVAPTTFAAEQKESRGHSVQINGIELHYEEIGTGKPLVLLHGFGGCAQDWQPFVAQLAVGHRLIIVEQRGHGHSTNPSNSFTHRQSANDVFALLNALGIDRFSAMGISSGGMTLLHMATRQPRRIESMVLIGASPYLPIEARTMMRESTADNMPPEVQAEYRKCATRGEAQFRQLAAQFSGLFKDYEDLNFTGPYLSTITARTLIVHGDRDFFFPVEIPLSVYRAIPDAALWIIPGGDHVPIYDPAVPFAATALKFLDDQGGKQR